MCDENHRLCGDGCRGVLGQWQIRQLGLGRGLAEAIELVNLSTGRISTMK